MKNQTPYVAPNARRDDLHPPLEGKTVTIVGLGGGAEIAFHLMRSGVGRFHLFDCDVLESGNLIRHSCGIKYVGMNKAEAVAELMREHSGGAVETIVHKTDVLVEREEARAAIAESDVVVVATDTDASRFFINEACVETGVPAVFAGMYEKGRAGFAFVYRPKKGGCYACLARSQNRADLVKKYQEAPVKSQCHLSRDAFAAPGIGIDQAFYNALVARKALETLLEGENHSLPTVGKSWIFLSLFGFPGAVEGHLESLQHDFPSFPDCECAVPE